MMAANPRSRTPPTRPPEHAAVPVPVVQIAAAVKPTPGAAGLLQPGLP